MTNKFRQRQDTNRRTTYKTAPTKVLPSLWRIFPSRSFGQFSGQVGGFLEDSSSWPWGWSGWSSHREQLLSNRWTSHRRWAQKTRDSGNVSLCHTLQTYKGMLTLLVSVSVASITVGYRHAAGCQLVYDFGGKLCASNTAEHAVGMITDMFS